MQASLDKKNRVMVQWGDKVNGGVMVRIHILGDDGTRTYTSMHGNAARAVGMALLSAAEGATLEEAKAFADGAGETVQ